MLVTIITDPIPNGKYFFPELLKRNLRRVINIFYKNRFNEFRGHFAVTRSLYEGLTNLKIDFNYNPFFASEVSQNVIVLSSCNALKQMIEFKRKGIVKNIFAGPNMFVWPHECKFIEHPEVNYCITPSEWVTRAYLKNSNIPAKNFFEWPAGVNSNYWTPTTAINSRKKITIFIKNEFNNSFIVQNTISLLNELGILSRDLIFIRRGEGYSYTKEEYFDALNESFLLIGFSTSESQGIAWAEAWSMDVPTIVLENSNCLIGGIKCSVSTSPYLNKETGFFFKNESSFSEIINLILLDKIKFSPRQWVLNNMTDEICAQNLINLINDCQSETI